MALIEKLAQTYNTYYDWASTDGKQFTHQNMAYVTHRWETLNLDRRYLLFMMSLVFDDSSPSPALVLWQQKTALIGSLDAMLCPPQHFHDHMAQGGNNNFQTSQEMVAAGRWSYNSTFRGAIPPILMIYALPEEAKRIRVVDKLGDGNLTEFDPDFTSFESVAIRLVTQILKMKDNDDEQEIISESFVTSSLASLVSGIPDRQKFVKNKIKQISKKYKRRIQHLKKSSRMQEERLKGCITSREACLSRLLKKLQVSNVSKVAPRDITAAIRRADNVGDYRTVRRFEIKACQHIHNWTREDAEEVSSDVRGLMDSVQIATTFLHSTTGGDYPVIKSVFDPSWNQRKDSPEEEKKPFTLIDMQCLHDIIEQYNNT